MRTKRFICRMPVDTGDFNPKTKTNKTKPCNSLKFAVEDYEFKGETWKKVTCLDCGTSGYKPPERNDDNA